MSLYRRTVLGLATLPAVERFARRHGWRLAARRIVAGESVAEALPGLRGLLRDGRMLILDFLGEYVHDAQAARDMAAAVDETLTALTMAGIPPVVSLKPTQLGLAVDPDLAAELAVAIARRAEANGGRVCFDMEDHRHVDATLALLGRVRAAGADGSSTVLQAYLHRTPADLESLLAAAPRSEVRIVKGAYHEPPAVALHDLGAIRRAFLALCERAWELGAKVNVATHDEGLLQQATAFLRGAGLARDRYELQLLYGVRPRLQQRLVDDGHPVRIYVPVGADWYGYFSRRLAERPANAAVVLRGILG